MTDLVVEMAEAESPSGDATSQEAMRSILVEKLAALDFDVQRLEGVDGCDHLRAEAPGQGGEETPHQLLLGHFDTVWPVGTLSRMPVEVREGRLYGPGVFDMKGGLVQMLFALRANHGTRLRDAVPSRSPAELRRGGGQPRLAAARRGDGRGRRDGPS